MGTFTGGGRGDGEKQSDERASVTLGAVSERSKTKQFKNRNKLRKNQSRDARLKDTHRIPHEKRTHDEVLDPRRVAVGVSSITTHSFVQFRAAERRFTSDRCSVPAPGAEKYTHLTSRQGSVNKP